MTSAERQTLDCSNRQDISDSLQRFVTQVNNEETGRNSGIVLTTLQGKYGGAAGSTDNLWFPHCLAYSGDYYLETPNSLGLAMETQLKSHPLLIAVSAFACGDNWISWYEPQNCDPALIPANNPVVLQLQGPSSVRWEKYLKQYQDHEIEPPDRLKERLEECQLAKALMKNLRWDTYLLRMWTRWAKSESIPNLFVLPGRMNRYYREDREQSFHMRYDVTAKRCRFRIWNNGLYGLSLT